MDRLADEAGGRGAQWLGPIGDWLGPGVDSVCDAKTEGGWWVSTLSVLGGGLLSLI